MKIVPGDNSAVALNMVADGKVWKHRRSASLLWSAEDQSLTGTIIVGLHAFSVSGRDMLIIIGARRSTARMYLTVVTTSGKVVYPLIALSLSTDPLVPSEPFEWRNQYSFVSFGNYVYFCNGSGNFYQMEFGSLDSATLRGIPYEQGVAPEVLSYISGNLKPSSLSLFFNQVLACGFTAKTDVTVFSPIDTTGKNPPRELVDASETTVYVDGRCAFLGEWNLFRSFPVEDPYGLFYIQESEIVAGSWFDDMLVFFCRDGVHLIQGIGSGVTYQRRRISDKVLAGPWGHCRVDGGCIFVADDGVYYLNQEGVKPLLSERMQRVFVEGIRASDITMLASAELEGTPFPFAVNRRSVRNAGVVFDNSAGVLYVSLPSNHSKQNDMVWAWDRATGQWSILFTPISTWVGSYDADLEVHESTESEGRSQMSWFTSTELRSAGRSSVYWGTSDGSVYTWGTHGDGDDGNRGESATESPVVAALLLGEIGSADEPVRVQLAPFIFKMRNIYRNPEHDAAAYAGSVYVRSSNLGNRLSGAVGSPYEVTATVHLCQEGVSGELDVLGTGILGATYLRPTDQINLLAQPLLRDDESSRMVADFVVSGGTLPRRYEITSVVFGVVGLNQVRQ